MPAGVFCCTRVSMDAVPARADISAPRAKGMGSFHWGVIH